MKKLILAGAFALLGAVTVNAQSKDGHFELGPHVGLPTYKGATLNLGVDAAYLWNVAPSFELGAITGYSHFFGKDYTVDIPGVGTQTIKAKGSGIVPLAATARYNFDGSKFNIGTDLGYAFYIAEGASGGDFYYQPKVGYDLGQGNLYLGFKGMGDANNGVVTLGYSHKF